MHAGRAGLLVSIAAVFACSRRDVAPDAGPSLVVRNNAYASIYDLTASRVDASGGWSSGDNARTWSLATGESRSIPIACGIYTLSMKTGAFGFCYTSAIDVCPAEDDGELVIRTSWEHRFSPHCYFASAVIEHGASK